MYIKIMEVYKFSTDDSRNNS